MSDNKLIAIIVAVGTVAALIATLNKHEGDDHVCAHGSVLVKAMSGIVCVKLGERADVD